MKSLFVSVSAATLGLASMTASAWWGPYAGPYSGPYAYGAPYLVAPPSPQQLQEMAERRREAVMTMMEAQRGARALPMPEWSEPPAFGERPSLPEMPTFGERPAIPQMPDLPKPPFDLTAPELPPIPEMPAMPAGLPEVPALGEWPAMPELSSSAEERQAEIDTYRAAFKQQAEARRAAMQSIGDQRRAIAEQRRQDWRCARQALRPMPYADWTADCASTGKQGQDKAEAGDQASDATAASSTAG